MEQEQQPFVYSGSENRFFRSRHNSTVCFAVAILLFFLPFVEIRCGTVPLISNSGTGIAFGQPWKPSTAWNQNELMRNVNKPDGEFKQMMKEGPNIFAIVALVCGMLGAIVAFSSLSWRNIAGMCAGILGALMLLAVLIQFRIQMRTSFGNAAQKTEIMDYNIDGVLKLSFTIWFWFSLVLFAAAAFLNYMRDRIALQDAIRSTPDFEFQQKQQT